jgi:CheY-like chemotaxis protein
MDIHMPEMDGLEASRKLMEIGCQTPIVALTANIMTTDRETYFDSGMRDCLSKPFVAHELWSCLLKFLKPISMMPIKMDIDDADEEEQRLELITAFVKSNQTTLSDIKSALESGDIKLAHRLAHTLKSVAGIVGMTALTQAAFVVEQALSAGNAQFLQEQLSTLEDTLNSALAELTPIADSHTGKSREKNKGKILDKESSLELLENLDSMLAADNFDSLNFLNNLSMIPGTEKLAEQIENMKFKEAREILAEIKVQLTAEDKHE